VIEFKPPPFRIRRRSPPPGNTGGAGSGTADAPTKAKIGMLIVHGSGQEMLDLLVATNLAVVLRRR
jgi:hypothetical protein